MSMKRCFLLLPTTFAALALLACSAKDGASFDREQKAVERAMPSGARLLSIAKSRSARGIEASWQYQLPSDPDSVRNLLRTAFQNGYQLVHEDANGLLLAKFDGGDSFHLSFSLEGHEKGSTSVHVTLTAMPG